jgi:DNA (cytosine-5)-methyltransferase 1
MTAYYNENDPYAAQWLRNLIQAGHVAPGDVDERSVADVTGPELAGYTQCHFFAGIGGWSAALRLAGWPDSRPVWTGSCPCQPFSAAGKGAAADDSRHLWPAWFPLIAERQPAILFGEQVEAAIGWGWLDAVFADLEGEGYACGATVLPACGIGAPHLRARLWFVAHALRKRIGPDAGNGVCEEAAPIEIDGDLSGASVAAGLGGTFDKLGDTDQPGQSIRIWNAGNDGAAPEPQGGQAPLQTGHWGSPEWLPCIDGKARPVRPGTFPLAHGVRNRVGRLRAYGNAIVPQVAAEFIKAAG